MPDNLLITMYIRTYVRSYVLDYNFLFCVLYNKLDCISIAMYYFFVAPYPIDVTSIKSEKTDDNNVRIMWKVCKYV